MQAKTNQQKYEDEIVEGETLMAKTRDLENLIRQEEKQQLQYKEEQMRIQRSIDLVTNQNQVLEMDLQDLKQILDKLYLQNQGLLKEYDTLIVEDQKALEILGRVSDVLVFREGLDKKNRLTYEDALRILK